MGQIKVMHIGGSLRYGGAEKSLVGLVNNLDKKCFNVAVCYLFGYGPLEEELDTNGVEVIKLHLTKANLLLSLYHLFRIMRIYQPDIVHTHLFSPGVLGRVVAKLAGVPVIIAHECGLTLWKKKWHIMYERWAIRFTDLRIAVSEAVRQNRITREKTASEKIVTIPNGVDTACFASSRWEKGNSRAELGLSRDSFCIGTVARLTKAKGLKYLLLAMKRVNESIPDVTLLIVGDGPLREELEEYSRELGIDDAVIFTGYRNDVPRMLAAMDVFVLASVWEGMPVSLLEAMAMQKPVVATRVGGIPEVIQDRVDGILIPPTDANELAKAIINIFKDREFSDNLALNARKRIVEHFSIESKAKRIGSLYQELIAEKTQRS